MTTLLSHKPRADGWLRRHWFVPLAMAIALGDVGALHFQDWNHPRLFEGAVLFDFAIVLPLLYLWCYRAPGKDGDLAHDRTCFARDLGGFPPDSRRAPARARFDCLAAHAGHRRACPARGENPVRFLYYKAVFASDSTPENIADKLATDLPLPGWVTRMLAFEARMLRRLSGWLKRLVNRPR